MRRPLLTSLMILSCSAQASYCMPLPGEPDELLRDLKSKPTSVTQVVASSKQPDKLTTTATLRGGRISEIYWLLTFSPDRESLVALISYKQTSPTVWTENFAIGASGTGNLKTQIELSRKGAATDKQENRIVKFDSVNRLVSIQGTVTQGLLLKNLKLVSVSCKYTKTASGQIIDEKFDNEGSHLYNSRIILNTAGQVETINQAVQFYDGPLVKETFLGSLGETVYYQQTRYRYRANGTLESTQTFDLGDSRAKARPGTAKLLSTSRYVFDAQQHLLTREVTADGRSWRQVFVSDKRGNWISRVERTPEGATITTTRTITY